MSNEELIRRAEDIRHAINYLIHVSRSDGFVMIGFFLILAELVIDKELAKRGIPRNSHVSGNENDKRH